MIQDGQLLNYVGGSWKRSRASEYLDVRDPATTEAIVRVPLTPRDEVDEAVRAAKAAFADLRLEGQFLRRSARSGQASREGWNYFTVLQHGIFCELGQGAVPFAGMLEDLRERGYNGWIVVEQAILPGMGSPRESALRTHSYLRSVGW